MNHINTKLVLGLGAAALLAISASFLMPEKRQPEPEPAPSGGFAVVGLREHVNDIRAITLTGGEDRTLLSLLRGEQGWTVREKAGYTADNSKLRELLLKLADAKLLDQRTANEQRYKDLGVEDTKGKDAKGVKVTLEGLAQPGQLIIGNINGKSGGTFVRQPGEKRSWLAKGNLSVERDPLKWLDTLITDIPAERINEIVLTKPGGKFLRVFKEHQEDADFRVADMPAGMQLSSPGAANGLASTLSSLHLQDVLPAAEAKQPPDSDLHNASYRTFDGIKVDIAAWQDGDKHYARFFATLEQARAEANVQETQAKAKADFEARQKEAPELAPPQNVAEPAKDREQRLAALAAEVATLTRRFGGWAFVIPSATYSNLDRSTEDLLKPVDTVVPEVPKEQDAEAVSKEPLNGKH